MSAEPKKRAKKKGGRNYEIQEAVNTQSLFKELSTRRKPHAEPSLLFGGVSAEESSAIAGSSSSLQASSSTSSVKNALSLKWSDLQDPDNFESNGWNCDPLKNNPYVRVGTSGHEKSDSSNGKVSSQSASEDSSMSESSDMVTPPPARSDSPSAEPELSPRERVSTPRSNKKAERKANKLVRLSPRFHRLLDEVDSGAFYEAKFFPVPHHNYLGGSAESGWLLLSITATKHPVCETDYVDSRVKLSEKISCDTTTGEFFSHYSGFHAALRWPDGTQQIVLGSNNLPLATNRSARLLKAWRSITPNFADSPFVELPSKTTPGRLLALEYSLYPTFMNVGLYCISHDMLSCDFYSSSEPTNCPKYNNFLSNFGPVRSLWVDTGRTDSAYMHINRISYFELRMATPHLISEEKRVGFMSGLQTNVIFLEDPNAKFEIPSAQSHHVWIIVRETPASELAQQQQQTTMAGHRSNSPTIEAVAWKPNYSVRVICREPLHPFPPTISCPLSPRRLVRFIGIKAIMTDRHVSLLPDMRKQARRRIDIIADTFPRAQERVEKKLGAKVPTSSAAEDALNTVSAIKTLSREALSNIVLTPLPASATQQFLKELKESSPDLLNSYTNGLLAVFCDASKLQQFKSFLLSTLALENLVFFFAVERYKASTGSNRLAIARDIYDDHLADHSRFCLNLPGPIRTSLRALFESDSPSLSSTSFFSAQESIFRLLQTDCYRRWIE